jgi:hypothetical protein
MPTLDELFAAPSDTPSHPLLRDWKRRLSDSRASAQLTVYRPTTALGLSQTEIHLQFDEDGQTKPLECFAWDDDLNAGLIQLGVRAADLVNEAERFALGLRGNLKKAERDFGDGYLNAVLLEFIRESDLAGYPEIDDVLKHAYSGEPDHALRGYALCREMVNDAFVGRAHELREQLGYDEATAKRILVDAIARYLDERFSVSNRRRLGLL